MAQAQVQGRVAVIGAGVSGLNCARHLKAEGWAVDVFDKARGLGGRLAAKRVEGIGSVDLGAQFMTVRTAELREVLHGEERAARAAVWPARIAYINAQSLSAATSEERWIGVPGMNTWLESLWPRANVRFNCQVAKLTRLATGQWQLFDQSGQLIEVLYDRVICALPPPQAAALCADRQWHAALSAIRMQPCWAALAKLELDKPLSFDAAFVRVGGLDWLAANKSKAGRTQDPTVWTLHAKAEHSEHLLEHASEQIAAFFQAELASLLAHIGSTARHIQILLTHRWRYATPASDPAPGIIWRPDLGLGACGDWAVGGRVEGAFTAGRLMAESVLREA